MYFDFGDDMMKEHEDSTNKEQNTKQENGGEMHFDFGVDIMEEQKNPTKKEQNKEQLIEGEL